MRLVAPLLVLVSLTATAAWAQDASAEDDDTETTSESSSDTTTTETPSETPTDTSSEGDTTEAAPEPPAPGQPLAIPGPASEPPDSRPTTPGSTAATPTAPRSTSSATPRPAAKPADPPPPDQDELLVLTDVGYRAVWAGPVHAPTGAGLGGRPQFMHANVHGYFDKHLMGGLAFDAPLNGRRPYFPFVLEARVGWWEDGFGAAPSRGPFRPQVGMKTTYIGARWVHNHFPGPGNDDWPLVGLEGLPDIGGLVVGYNYAAPFGRFTVITDTQFSLYLIGWKNRSEFPIGLLNQRISLGFDPVFIDARIKADPATGTELSVGLSFQGLMSRRQIQAQKARRAAKEEASGGGRYDVTGKADPS